VRHARLLFLLYSRPGAAIGGILDQGTLLFASVAAIAVTALLQWSAGGSPGVLSSLLPLVIIAAVYVPGMLAVAALIGRLGGVGVVFGRDYSPLLACTLMCWSAANLPICIAGWIVSLPYLLGIAVAAYLYFIVLMFFVVRTVFGIGNGAAVGVVAVSWVPLVAVGFFWGPLSMILRWLTSPFLLLYAWFYLGGEFANIGAGLRRRQHYGRMLEAAAVNPHDSDAQYQLGLIYQQRHQFAEAIQRFRNAVAINPDETDAHFQLGRIAREQGRLGDALGEFQIVVDQDERHSSSEVLRELGAIYIEARQYEDARKELAVYIDRWPYDPEGLYYYGVALEQLGEAAQAREMFRRAIESARSAPRFRKRYVAPWSRLAQKRLRKVEAL
jgi:tetratricopeptide (TPR) repeat protein